MHMVTIPVSNAIIIFLNFMPIMSSANNPFQTFWTQFRPNIFSGQIWVPTVWHTSGFNWKVCFEKNQQTTKMQNYPACNKFYLWALSVPLVTNGVCIVACCWILEAWIANNLCGPRSDSRTALLARYKVNTGNCSRQHYLLRFWQTVWVISRAFVVIMIRMLTFQN